MSSLPKKKCENCQEYFMPRHSRARYCSRPCVYAGNAKQFYGKHFATNSQFQTGHSTWNKGLKGYNAGAKNPKWKGGQLQKVCAICQTSFLVDRDRTDARTCSMECNKLFRQTEEFRSHLSEIQRSKISNDLRNLTITVARFKNLLRRCYRYNLWREKIFNRDDFTCQGCGKRGGKLCVNHIEPFITIIARNGITSYEEAVKCKELWDVNNGQTMCYPCHYCTPTFGSRVLPLLANSMNNE